MLLASENMPAPASAEETRKVQDLVVDIAARLAAWAQANGKNTSIG